MAVAAASPPAASALSAGASFGIPDSTGSIGIGIPISPVEQTSTSRGAQPSDLGRELGHAERVAAARLAGGGVGVAGVEDDRRRPAVVEVDAADLHRRRRDQVGREHPGGGDRRVVGGGHDAPDRERPTA